MALSGTKSFTADRDQIINGALRKIGAYDSSDAPTPDEMTSATVALNSLIKELSAEGIGLWLRKRVILILNSGTERYKLTLNGNPGTVDDFHACADHDIIEGTGDEIELAGETVISQSLWVNHAGQPITDSPGITAPSVADVVGIRLEDGTMWWSTVAAADATSVTLDDAIPAGKATRVGSKIYTYTTQMNRPSNVLSVQRRDTSGNSTPVELIGRIAYENLSKKDSSGSPVKAHYDPQRGSTEGQGTGVLHVWPVKNPISLDKLYIVVNYYADDMDAAADEIGFPIEWANCLTWLLAKELSFEYGVDVQTRNQIVIIAEQKKLTLLNTMDVENASVSFAMDDRGAV
jgi:hypothetical protein